VIEAARIKQTLNGQGQPHLYRRGHHRRGFGRHGAQRQGHSGREVKSGPKPRTDFAEFLAPFTIENGVFHTSETSLKSPLLRLLAAGKADLVKETLDFKLDTKLVGTIKGPGGCKGPLRPGGSIIVSGSFSDPSFRPDVEAIAKDQLKKALGAPEAGALPTSKEKARDLIKA